jgi:HSP20 family protein
MFKKKNKKKIESEQPDTTSSPVGSEREFFYNLDEIEAETQPSKLQPVSDEEETEDEDDEIIVEEVARNIPEDNSVDSDTENESEDWVTGDDKLPIDVYQDPYNIYITSPMPGVDTDNIDININNDMITIRGRRQMQFEADDDDFFFRECYWGNVSRSVILPVEIDSEKVEATLKNGILTITLPKVGTGRDIRINVRGED